MQPTPEGLQLAALRKLYAKAHQQLQVDGMEILQLKARLRALEDEVQALRGTIPYSHGAENDAG